MNTMIDPAPAPTQGADVTLRRRQSLEASVVRACTNPECGAGGVFHDVPGVNVAHYDPERKDQPVGPICLCCGAERPADEPQGEIWSREYR